MEEKPKRDLNDPREANPCPICGGTAYEWGKPGSEGGVYYLPEGAIFGLGMGEGLESRKCQRCGNVQLFVKG